MPSSALVMQISRGSIHPSIGLPIIQCHSPACLLSSQPPVPYSLPPMGAGAASRLSERRCSLSKPASQATQRISSAHGRATTAASGAVSSATTAQATSSSSASATPTSQLTPDCFGACLKENQTHCKGR